MCTKCSFYIKVRINFSVSEFLLCHFLKLGMTLQDTGLAFDCSFLSLFLIEATPLACVNTPFTTFCTSWFLGMWPLLPLQRAVEGTWEETDRLGRSA